MCKWFKRIYRVRISVESAKWPVYLTLTTKLKVLMAASMVSWASLDQSRIIKKQKRRVKSLECLIPTQSSKVWQTFKAQRLITDVSIHFTVQVFLHRRKKNELRITLPGRWPKLQQVHFRNRILIKLWK